MIKVLTYGTFDTFHYGHLNLLNGARQLGDELIVGLSTDEFNSQKGKKAFHSWETRKKYLECLKLVDMVIPEKSWEQKIEDVRKHRIDIFVMGDDWKGKFDLLKAYCNVVYLPRTKNVSSTQLRALE